MFDRSKKVGLGDVSQSLRKSRVRSEIMMYLYNNYPEASHPAEIAKNTGIDSKNVFKGLRGTGWLNVAKSLLKQGVVEEIERENETYYLLSERGKLLVESQQEA